jgi:ABC-2 type transport system ATP-binding protein
MRVRYACIVAIVFNGIFVVEVKEFCKTYNGIPAARGVSFCARQGCVTGLLGPNGSGKTTILKAAAAIHAPTNGKVFVRGIDAGEEPEKARALVGYAAENARLIPHFTVSELLFFAARTRFPRKSRAAVNADIERVTEELALNAFWDTKISRLSKGFSQRASLALALVHDPAVLVLDEPASGLDPAQMRDFRALLSMLAQTKTVILSTHLMHEAESLCAYIVMLKDGEIAAQGSKEDLLRRAAASSLEEAYLSLCASQ